jgi:uncharacterized repeat protein (TIGR01451 family)
MPVSRALRFALLALVLAAIAPAAASAAPVATFENQFKQNVSGNITMTGNALLTCPDSAASCATAKGTTASVAGVADNDFTMTYVDVDNDPATFDSSTATLNLPAGAKVLFAGLYWGARTDGVAPGTAALNVAAKNTALLKPPGGAYAAVTASGSPGTIGGTDTAYQHFADVTAAVKAGGAGLYGVANVQAGTGADRYAGWALVVAYEDLDQPPRNLSVFDGLTVVSQGTPAVDIGVSGFTTAPSGDVKTTLGAIAYEGDLGKTGDGMKLQGVPISDGANPVNDLFNSSVSVNGTRTMTGRSPAQQNHLGFDADLFAADGILANHVSSATLTVNTASTNGETIYPGVLTFASELLAAKIRPATSVVDLNGGNPEPGDVLEYTGVAENTGNGTATGLRLESAIPAGVELVPDSLELLEDEVTGAQTPALDADRVSYDPATGKVTWNVGTGATPSAGGSLAVGSKVRIRYRVKIAAPADGAALPADTIASYGTLDTSDHYTTTGTGGSLSASSPDLAMDLTRDGELVRGQAATYTLAVTNTGSAPSKGVVQVTDALPAGLPADGAPSGEGWDCAVAGQLVSCTRSDELASHGAFAPVSVPVRVRQDAPGVIVNAATVIGEGDGIHGNDSDSDDGGLPAARSAVALALEGATTISPGDTATLTARVTSAGPSDATGVQVALPLPAGLELVSATTGDRDCVVTSCAIGTVPAGGEGTAVYVVRATRAAAGSSRPLTATVATAVTDTTAGDDSATASVAVRDLRLVAVTQSVDPDPLAAGAPATIDLEVRNDGPSTASGVVLTEPLPAQLRNATADIDPDHGTCAIADGALRCELAPLADGARVPVTVHATVASSAAGAALDLTASVAAVDGDPDPSDDSVTVHRTVAGAADLALASVRAPATLRSGERGTWVLRATDAGPGDATGATLAFALPAGLRLVSADGAACTTVAGAVSCVLGTIEAGAHRDVTLVLAADAGAAAGDLALAPAVTADEPDPDAADARLDLPFALTRAADLRVTQSGAAEVVAGTAATFSASVTNAGPSDATHVVVTESVPASLTAPSAKVAGAGSCAAPAGTTITCSIPRLAVGERRAIELSGTVARGAGGQALVATTRAGASEPDANAADNEASHRAPAATVSDVSVSALAPAGTIPAGTQTQVTLRVRNDGPSDTTGVVLKQTLPAAAQAVDLDPRCTVSGRVVTCAFGALVVGDERPIVIKVRAIRAFDGALLGTGASVAANGRDPQPANDSLAPVTAEPIRCTSRRTFTIHLRVPPAAKLKSVSVIVAGKPVRVRVGRRLTAVVDLRTRPAGRILVRIRAVTRGGRHIVGTRAYQTCTVKRPTRKPPRV